ncbi:transglycosylase SLT domain-containing protein [Nonomuraea zeae]|uniref:Lytic transglycosylase n=1 Tax=Nonomuraea zeae TaxID=1642303 RepID=A0A5S4G298_9ACTN|nr:transglycosylase SLT domain-containing protein [Nonomuraea zeae]TMR27086.1 lytic transglycosylase [Nonomuraea zeae]
MSVAHLPGGAALDTMLNKVTGDPGKIDALAKAWRSVSGDINEFAGALGAAVQTVDDAWQGRSADQFATYMNKYGAAGENLNLALSNAAGSLDDAATALRESHTEISAICRDLNTNARNYRTRFFNNNPDAKEEDVTPGLTTLVNQAKTDAQPWVDSADRAVTKAKNAIKSVMDERGLTFRDIPDVSTQEFTPENGRKLDWERDPSYQESRTSTQSASGGNGSRGGSGGGGFGGYGPSGPPPAGGGPAPTGQLKEWIEEAMSILAQHGVPASKMNASDIAMIIRHESGGNPNAINNWDSNAAKGTPSKGLMQTIDPTFNSYSLAGHKNIYNPVDNIIAGVRYAISRYGSVSNVPGVVGTKTGSGYVGY